MSYMTDLFLVGPPLCLALGTAIVAWFSVRSSRKYRAEAERNAAVE